MKLKVIITFKEHLSKPNTTTLKPKQSENLQEN